MKNTSCIGVTLFNLRDYCKDVAGLDSTLNRVRSIGYENIQVSGVGSIEPEVIKELADKYELSIVATHEAAADLDNDMAGVIAKLKSWECDFTALGFPGKAAWDGTAEGVPALLDKLAKWGTELKEAGVRFGYHNHDIEFEKFNSRILLEQIYTEVPATTLYAEIDVHWVARGGGDPVAWIKKVAGRMPVIHVKDMTIVDRTPEICEIGEGNLNWPAIIKACQETNVSYLIVEQDRPFQDRDIFESMKISFDNMRAMGLH